LTPDTLGVSGAEKAMCQEKLLALDFSKEEALTKVLPKLPALTSKNARWNGIYLAYDYQLPGETPEFAAQQHGISIFNKLCRIPLPQKRCLRRNNSPTKSRPKAERGWIAFLATKAPPTNINLRLIREWDV